MAAAGFGSQALPYEIKVIEGDLSVAILQTGEPPGVISLEGRSGPLQPITYEVGMRTNKMGTQNPVGILVDECLVAVYPLANTPRRVPVRHLRNIDTNIWSVVAGSGFR